MWTKLRDPGTGTAAQRWEGPAVTSRPEFSRSRGPANGEPSRAGPGGCVWTESALTARHPHKDDASGDRCPVTHGTAACSPHLVLPAAARELDSRSGSG